MAKLWIVILCSKFLSLGQLSAPTSHGFPQLPVTDPHHGQCLLPVAAVLALPAPFPNPVLAPASFFWLLSLFFQILSSIMFLGISLKVMDTGHEMSVH